MLIGKLGSSALEMTWNFITLALAFLPSASPTVSTLPRDQVEKADPMELRGRLLPAELRESIIEGAIHRIFVPGYWYRATYLTAPQPVDAGFCTRTQHSIDLKATTDSSGIPHNGPDLVIGPMKATELWGVSDFPALNADSITCKSATGFVPIGDGEDGQRRASAYRFLASAMREARDGKPLPFKLECKPSANPSCGDPHEALANLPLDALFRIDVTNPQRDILSTSEGGRVFKTRPIEENGPYDVEFAFGRSGKDGQSWRIIWRQTGQTIDEIKMRRSAIIYH